MRNDMPEDPNFSERRNRAVIARTIRKNEAMRKKRVREYWQGGKKTGLHERIDMAASFIKAKDMGGKGATNIDRYLGKRLAAKLRAEQIINRLRNNLN